MRRGLLPLLLFAIGCGGNPDPGGNPPPAADKVELTAVTVADLDQAIASHKGKVVLIDAWFLRCAPCRKKFPSTVELHRKFAADGLVVMSLDIIPGEWEEREEVLKFLTDHRATFPNYIFKDRQQKVDNWTEKYNADITPALVVFDRGGKRVVVPRLKTAEDEEQFVRQLLGK